MARLISYTLLFSLLLAGCHNEVPLEESIPSPSVKRGIHSRVTASGLTHLESWATQQWLEEFGSGAPLSFINEPIENINDTSIQFSSTLELPVEEMSFTSPPAEGQLHVVLTTSAIEWTGSLSIDDTPTLCELTITASGAHIQLPFNPHLISTDEEGTDNSLSSCEWASDASVQFNCPDPSIDSQWLDSIDWLQTLGNSLAIKTAIFVKPYIAALLGDSHLASGIVQQSRADGSKSEFSYAVSKHLLPSSDSPLASNNGDLVLSMDLGIDSKTHPCVPPGPAPAPIQAEILTVNTWLDGDLANTHDFAIAVHQSSLEQAIHHTYRAGFLCNSILLDQMPRSTQMQWEEILPILSSFESNHGLKIQLQPLAPPTVSLSTDGFQHPLSVHLFFPSLRVEAYGHIEDTPVRLYEIRSSASVALEPRFLDSGWLSWDVIDVHAGPFVSKSPIGDIPFPDADQIDSLYQEALHGLLHDQPMISLGALQILPWTLIDARSVSGEQAIFYFDFETGSTDGSP